MLTAPACPTDPRYGYALKGEFEAATGQIWPLNDGQVYTTLSRLERDGLVQAEAGPERLALFAVGASPAVLRRTAASAALVAVLGAALAVPAGLLPVAAIYPPRRPSRRSRSHGPAWPWPRSSFPCWSRPAGRP